MKNSINIAAIESSGSNCSAALMINGELFSEYNIFEKNLHDKFLAEFTKRIISDAGLSPDDISAIAVSSGPGSFTGLRISGAVAKGFCFDDKTKLIQVPTLEGLAYYIAQNMQIPNGTKITATVKAHKDLLYYQIFDNAANKLSEPEYTDLETFRSEVSTEQNIICGSAANELQEYHSIKEFNCLAARFTALKALQLYKENSFVAADQYVPYYIQEFQPKTNKKE